MTERIINDLKLLVTTETIALFTCISIAFFVVLYYYFVKEQLPDVNVLRAPAFRNALIFRFLMWGNIGSTMYLILVCIDKRIVLISPFVTLLIAGISFIGKQRADNERFEVLDGVMLIDKLRREFSKLGYSIEETVRFANVMHSTLAGLNTKEKIDAANEAVRNKDEIGLFKLFCNEVYENTDNFRSFGKEDRLLVRKMLEIAMYRTLKENYSEE